MRQLNGKVIESIDINVALDTTFTFQEGLVLRLFSLYREQYEHWQLRYPDGNVLVLGPGVTWWFGSGSSPGP